VTVYKRFDQPCYTVKLMLPELAGFFRKYRKQSSGLIADYVTIPRIHMGLKYLGFQKKFTDNYMKRLIPDLRRVAKKHLPLKITVKGLGAFWSSPRWPRRNPAIYLKVVVNKELRAFHSDVCNAVRTRVDTFSLAEGRNYHPHVSLGSGKNEKIKELKKLIARSRNAAPVTILAHRMAMRLSAKSVHYVLKV